MLDPDFAEIERRRDEPPDEPHPRHEDEDTVLGFCPHGVNLDREFCPDGCRV